MNRKRLNLSLNLGNPKHLKLFDEMEQVPIGQRTDVFCDLVLIGLSVEKQGDFFREILREELNSVVLQPKNLKIEPEAEEISDDVLGFLRSL